MQPTVSLIVNTFDQPEYLARVLRAVGRQTSPPEEVLLADDGSGAETRRVFDQWRSATPSSTLHFWQPKEGFRRARILNAAIAAATGDYVVFLDGDTIPHPKFIADHRALARRGFCLQGHRVLVNEPGSRRFGRDGFSTDRARALLSGHFNKWKHVYHWPVPFRRIVPGLDGVRGCNLSVWRSDLIGVNGYNEDYRGWGCEDLDIVLRLKHSGIRRRDVRGWALCYHLWHPPADRANLAANEALLEETARRKTILCDHGLDAHSPTQPTPAPFAPLDAVAKDDLSISQPAGLHRR